jgi:hypothetical protein
MAEVTIAESPSPSVASPLPVECQRIHDWIASERRDKILYRAVIAALKQCAVLDSATLQALTVFKKVTAVAADNTVHLLIPPGLESLSDVTPAQRDLIVGYRQRLRMAAMRAYTLVRDEKSLETLADVMREFTKALGGVDWIAAGAIHCPNYEHYRATQLAIDTFIYTELIDDINKTAPRCAKCGCISGLHCGRCKRTNYCSVECQRSDFAAHKPTCTPSAPTPPAAAAATAAAR